MHDGKNDHYLMKYMPWYVNGVRITMIVTI